MKLQDQVCTLEQAKRLKELGVAQHGYFKYSSDGYVRGMLVEPTDYTKFKYTIGFPDQFGLDEHWDCIAFTVAELGMMLPTLGYYVYPGYECRMSILNIDTKGSYIPLYAKVPDFRLETEAQSRAAMLIYLLENNLITAEEVNNRLSHE